MNGVCVICGSPAEYHHVRRLATTKKRKNAPGFYLCPLHHRTGGHGVAIHAGRKTWEQNFGEEMSYLEEK